MTTDHGEGVVRRFWEEIFGQATPTRWMRS